MRTLRDAGRGRVRRPVALAATAVIAAMLVPAGAAVADTPDAGETTTTTSTTTTTEPVEVQTTETTEPVETTPGEDAGEGTDAGTVTTTSTTEGGEESEGGGDDTVVIVPEDTETQPVDVTPAPGGSSGNQQSTSGQSGPEELQQMWGSFDFSGLTTNEWDEPVATTGTRINAIPVDWPAGAVIDVDWWSGARHLADGLRYTPTSDDLGQMIEIAWTVTADGYEPSNGGMSVASDTVAGLEKMYGQIDVSGATGEYGDKVAYVGRTLVASPDAGWPADAQFVWSWEVDGVERSTTNAFTPSLQDLGRDIWVYVDVTAPGFQPVSTGVNAASTVIDVPPMPHGSVEVAGLGEDGQTVLGRTLTASAKAWPAGSSYVYTWRADGDVRATGATYTPTATDLGKYLEVQLTVTNPAYQPGSDWHWAGTVVTTPTVKVPATTVVVGDQALLPVTVSGPKGGPVPTGQVEVKLTPRGGGDAIWLASQTLDHGTTGFVVADVAVGVYDVEAYFQSKQIIWNRVALLDAGPAHSPYLKATGTGTLTVTALKPAVSAPGAVRTAVATAASFDASVSLKGQPFSTAWTVREGSTVLTRGESGKQGTFSVTLPVLSVGTHTLVLDVPATAWSAAASTTVVVTVVGEPARTGTTPTQGTTLDTPAAATTPGQQMELVAEGFLPGETVAFYLHSEPMFLGTAVAGADGVARLLATIPAGAPTGAHTVIATGGTSGRWATLAVELAVPAATPVANPVAAAPVATAPAALAVTGSQTGSLMTGAWLLLLVGGGLVLVARRVRTTR
ncbi:hypothetical protein [Cellulomonas triticagri]|uniref:LPXTG cell wall anchor domain-containing protein n=1 Tax=Cellulomonas triticagri TaxID=2483352 RepID=A0A3M2JLF6_9CELL|nr:hypothetical protein [Cellulomonas triticagri]RMI14429.1 hypothetical protein EBM89_00180 [Cellulomonas triticagri]